MNTVVYFDGVMLNPGNLFLCAQGIASRVNMLPTVPNVATIMHLKTKYKEQLFANVTNTYMAPAVMFKASSKGNSLVAREK